MNYIGIDLGTTYSAVATLDESGQPVILKNKNKSASSKRNPNLTASAVWFKDDQPVVGEQARNSIGIGKKVASRFKRDMGKTGKFSGVDFTPTELSALVLREMKKIAEDNLGQVGKAVVTIPANFSNEARVATIKAASMAGLDVEHIINEPTAAALHYAYRNKETLHGYYAVYDLGGGTFDISVISISGNQVDVMASNGISELGGVDFDALLRDSVSTEYQMRTGDVLDPELYTLTEAEEDKIKLSETKRAIAGGAREYLDDETIFITRSEFEEAISSRIAQAEMTCEATISEAGVKLEDIKGVILVGGSTRMPIVRESVKRVFKQEPIITEDPDEAVAFGAALYAAIKNKGEGLSVDQKRAVSDVSLTEIANHYFGTISLYKREGGKKPTNIILINKGEKLPCSASERFATTHDGQTRVYCVVTQSATPESDPRFVKKIKELDDLELPPGRPKGQEIEVIFSYDDNQIMHCSFKDLASGKERKVTLDTSSPDNDTSAIDKFLVD